MKRKFFSVLIALVLVVSFSLVMAAPAAAATTLTVIPYTLGATGGNAATWSTAQAKTGSSSVNLTHVGGASIRAYVQFAPPAGITLAEFVAAPTTYGFSYWRTEDKIGPQLELTFTDGANGWVELTAEVALYDYITDDDLDQWIDKTLSATEQCQFFGDDSADVSFSSTGLGDLSDLITDIAAVAAADDAAAVGAWEMTQAIVDCGWSGDTQVAYVDDVIIDGTTYNLEGTAADYSTIQSAIDAASSDDVISVGAGTYTSSTIHVHTTENLTIESVSGAATTIISGSSGTDKLFEIGGHSGNTADNFTLDGFTLTGTYNYGVYMYVRGFDIKNNIITNPVSDGIVVTNPTTGPPPEITSGTINNNTITGKGANAMLYRPGILLEANNAANAEISNIIITNNTVSGFGTTTVGVEAAGIRVASVTGCGVADNITVTGNTLTGNYIGLHVYGASTGLEISSNTMSANNAGVAVCNSGAVDVSSTFNLDRNTITNNTGYGVHIIQTASEDLSGAKNIMYNVITGNGAGIQNDFSTGTAPVATYNYWGTAAGPYHATTNPGVSGYRGDAVSDNVTYAPWLFYTTAANSGATLATLVSNEVPAYANSVVLSSGWNTFSVPIGLDGQYNTWAELITLTSANYTLAYRFNPATQSFVALATDSTDALAPGEGIYIKMNEAGSIPYCYSTVVSIPSRALGDGWNFIGGGMTTQDEIITCVSIATVGSTAGYTQIISPAENAAGSWIWTTGLSTQGDFVVGEGYWVFLPIDRTLGLFDLTPVTWVALP